MDEPDPAPDMIDHPRENDPKEAEELFARYAKRLTRLAEGLLSDKLAGRLDGEDVVQSVFRTFFRRSAEGEFLIDSSAQLWRLLVKITIRKTRAKGRFHVAKLRDVRAETHGDGDEWFREAVATEPGPMEAAILVDQIESLLQGLPPLHCRVLDLRLQGHGPSEIATLLKVSRQTVHRVLALLQKRLEGAGS